jgi:large subunit ribosomal protein L32
MGLPAKRRTKQSKRERSSHFALEKPNLIACSHCGKKILSHRTCPHCGYYRGRDVLHLNAKLTKAQKKTQEKASKDEHAGHDHE